MRFLAAGVLLAGSALVASAGAVSAKEFYVGEPVVRQDLQLVPHYLTGIRMEPMADGMEMSADAVHLELDVHATKDETHGFAEDMWIPNLAIQYTLEKVGDPSFRKTGRLVPMSAKDGPHYANNVGFKGDGQYKVTFRLSPPTENGFFRHVDTETGVPVWWQPFTVDWTFAYPAKEAAAQ